VIFVAASCGPRIALLSKRTRRAACAPGVSTSTRSAWCVRATGSRWCATGVNHFLVFRVAGTFGVGLSGAAAQMRGETLEQFKHTRRVWEER